MASRVIPKSFGHFTSLLWFVVSTECVFWTASVKIFVWLFVLIALPLVIILDNFSPDMRNGPLNFFTSSPPHALGPCHLQNRIAASSQPQSVSIGDMMGWRGVCLLSAHVIRMATTWIPNWILWKRSPTKCSLSRCHNSPSHSHHCCLSFQLTPPVSHLPKFCHFTLFDSTTFSPHPRACPHFLVH